ncbi:SusC/RagA family TonB-linked outer membrane protein [Flavobacterium hydrophilum]|uniref:SusC/RagA family TonB-linked outer membrane protein n=1 Tax=Flavobacterium hydrophilum TaxID=2211445 RepID=A0A2V4C7S6_9FLAO|nr:SusC/RagA family TonB-linked outer membrane protein [Flavobacterium hydrophilum]PXY46000.1 SusC/RagA family TonB-linked outer membrane protein [Flavobacterium hydrophilum]
MNFKLTDVIFYFRKRLIINIMRTFIFLFCTTIFGFSPLNLFSQNAKIVIKADKTVTVDEVFDLIKQQTNYTFIYQEDLFKKLPKVHLKKGKIRVNDLLEASFPKKDFNFSFANGNTIVVKETPVEKVVVFQQSKSIEIRGTVTNNKKEPLPGVNIKVKGTNETAQTDFDGKYTITAPNDGILLFTYIGHTAEIIAVNNRKLINVALKEETKQLEGVVINTGVTVRKKELITGAVTTFKGEELRQVSTQNAVQALKSLDPSFIVLNNNISGSNPNILPTIEVRGQTSLTANQVDSQFRDDPNQPLFILDGFPTTLQQVVDLDINRIASITLLKDAASTALYGSRSANGVVVIETNKPLPGKLQFSYVYNSSYELADLSVYNLMNAEQKLEFERLSGAYTSSAFPAYEYSVKQVYDKRLAAVRSGVNTYWLNEPIQMGITSGHSLSFGGGSDEFRFNIAGNYKSLTGTMKGSEHNTWGYNATLTYRKNKLSINNNFFVSGGDNQESQYGSFETWAKASPYYPKYNENGEITRYLDGSSLPLEDKNVVVNHPANPLYNVFLPSYNKKNEFNFTNNFGVNYDVNAHLKTTGALSVSRNTSVATVFVSPDDTRFISNIATEKGTYTNKETLVNKWNANLGATYSNVFSDVHSFNYTIRASAQETTNNAYNTALRGFPLGVPGNPTFAFGYEPNGKPGTYTGLIRSVDLTNQINYAYNRKYLFDFTQTISGATNFGTNKKYSPYWGAGIGWNVNNEFKMNEDIVNILKLRANIGQTGNQNLVGYASYDVYSYDINTNVFGPGLAISQVANPNLEPQRTKDLSVGLDLGMFRNRLTATLGAYKRKTSPQIVAIDLAASTGVNSYPLNVGYLTTEGIEFKLNYNFIYDLKDNFIWGIGLMGASGDNKLGGFNNALSSLNTAAQKTTSLTRYYDGASSNDLWAVPSLGIDPATGREIFRKKDGQSTFTLDKKDEVVMGNSRETATGVVSTNLTYKGFSFGLFVRYSFGAERFNTALYNKVENISKDNIFDNQDARAFTDRWTTPGQVAQFKAIGLTNATPISSRFIQKDDYISGESIRLGYRVTDRAWLKRAGLVGLGFNALANEFFRVATIKAERGIEYPFSRIYSLSLNVSF